MAGLQMECALQIKLLASCSKILTASLWDILCGAVKGEADIALSHPNEFTARRAALLNFQF